MQKVTGGSISAIPYGDMLSTIYLAEMSFDQGDFDVHESLLADDFVFESPFGSFHDNSKYLEWLRSFYHQVTEQGGTRHIVQNPIVRLDGSKATVISYLVVINRKTMQLMGTSILTDHLVAVDNSWKFIRREIFSDQFQ